MKRPEVNEVSRFVNVPDTRDMSEKRMAWGTHFEENKVQLECLSIHHAVLK